MGIVEDIVAIEWKEIVEIKKTDENQKEFEVMRKSQFELWPQPLLESYLQDLEKAEYRGWNLISEKYARILEFTDFVAYQNIEHMIPKVDEATEEVIDMAVLFLDYWMNEFEKRYPRLANTAKGIQVYTDQEDQITYKQLVKAELMTYSANTIMLFANMIIDIKKQNRNYIQMMMEITCKYYNFAMIDEAERKL